MKKQLLTLLIVLSGLGAIAQTNIPQLVSFSAVVRDQNNNPLANTAVSLRLTFRQGGQSGPLVYCALHQDVTNANGFISIQLNRNVLGTACNGAPSTAFEDIPWENGGFWMDVEYQTNPGNPFINLGQLELASTFYAFAARTAESISGFNLSGAQNGDVLTYNISTQQWEAAPAGGGFSGDYNDLTNTPTLSTVATSGDYNDLSNTPTNVSEFNNDAGYLTQAGLSTVATTGDYNDLTNAPALSAVATSGDYSDLSNTPTNVSEFNNDAGYVTQAGLSTVATTGDYNDLTNAPALSAVATSGDYNDLTNAPTIPTVPNNVSAFTNDAGYVTTLNDDDATNELQQLSVSATGDTLYLQNGGFVIIPGISAANAPAQLATLSTTAAIFIGDISAVSGGNITNNGGANVTARGVVWSTSQTPSLSNNLGSTSDGTGIGSFTSNITGLTANTTYYVRAYATNSAGTAYGNEVSFTTLEEGQGSILNPDLTYGSVTDQDGNTYATIVIGTQEWMAENLRTTSYANGDPIPNVTDAIQWQNLTTGAWAHINNDSQYENPFGKLYNWYTVADPRNVCPVGWHVPTDAEWTVLADYLGGENVAGGKMKSTGTQYWQGQNTAATNESGFSGLPGGLRSNFGYSNNFGQNGYWWSSTEYSTDRAWDRDLNYVNGNLYRLTNIKTNGFSVRCLKD